MSNLIEKMKNNKQIVLYFLIGFMSFIGIIIIIVIMMNIFKKYDISSLENIVVTATSKYLKANDSLAPTETNQTVSIDIETLIANKYLKKDLNQLSKDTNCSGTVNIYYTNKGLRYTPLITCDNYKPMTLSSKILSQESITTKDTGLYSLNNFNTYRGEYVNNYISYAGYTWRIFKFNQSITYLILSDTVNGKITYVYDDRYNETSDSFKGKNSFQNSRIELMLNDIYQDNFKNNQLYMEPMNSCVGVRSETDKDITGNAECASTYLTNISLMAVYDYMNASIDPSCTSASSRNCANYNYLAVAKNKWWLLNGTNENTYQIYSANIRGELSLDTANTKKYLRPVIAIYSNALYHNGDGTSDHPYTIYEY